jgi:hypothetical protein
MRIGGEAAPYGSFITFSGGTRIEIIAPATFTVSSDTTSLLISSTTPSGVYTSDGETITKK